MIHKQIYLLLVIVFSNTDKDAINSFIALKMRIKISLFNLIIIKNRIRIKIKIMILEILILKMIK